MISARQSLAISNSVDYRAMTVDSRNPLKRFVQRSRFKGALRLIPKNLRPQSIFDYGGGDGELCRHLARRYPTSTIVCYEPAAWLQKQALENLKDFTSASVTADKSGMAPLSCDLLFCLEVFEHLPPQPFQQSLADIHSLLKSNGIAIISVPIEIYLPALLKGVFRLLSRYGDAGSQIAPVFGSFLGHPPRDRSIEEISPGVPFHFSHLGFDFRAFEQLLKQRFAVIRTATSPFPLLGTWFNSQVYFVCSPR